MEQGQKEGQLKENIESPKDKKAKKSKEKKGSAWETIESIAAAPIFLHDKVQATLDGGIIYVWRTLVTEVHNARTRYKSSSQAIITSLFSLMIVVCALLLVLESFTTYEYSYNGRVLGYVKSQDTVVDLLSVASEGLSSNNRADIVFTANDNVTFRLVSADKRDNDTADQVLNKLTYMTDVEVNATGIYYDDNLVAIVENQAVAESLITNVMNIYGSPDENMVVQSAEYMKPVTTQQLDVLLTSLSSRVRALELMMEGGEYNIYHTVKPDETVESLSEIYDVPVEEIYQQGRTYPASVVVPGEIVRMKKETKPMVVRMEEKGTTTEVMRFDREIVDTDELYIGETEVSQKGEDGLRMVTGTIVKENGVEVERNITNTEIIKEPVTEIILNGTLEKPKTAPTGRIEMPLKDSFHITSWYGPRWGRVHAGVDLACPTGTPVYAADGGKVIRASWYGSYGNCIEVEHDDGTYTRYAHLSAYEISMGDLVYQGQLIGRVGNTGFSTGSHLHFELHPNGGEAVDPAPILGIEDMPYYG